MEPMRNGVTGGGVLKKKAKYSEVKTTHDRVPHTPVLLRSACCDDNARSWKLGSNPC